MCLCVVRFSESDPNTGCSLANASLWLISYHSDEHLHHSAGFITGDAVPLLHSGLLLLVVCACVGFISRCEKSPIMERHSVWSNGPQHPLKKKRDAGTLGLDHSHSFESHSGKICDGCTFCDKTPCNYPAVHQGQRPDCCVPFRQAWATEANAFRCICTLLSASWTRRVWNSGFDNERELPRFPTASWLHQALSGSISIHCYWNQLPPTRHKITGWE